MKYIVVTGSNGGMGKATVLSLLEKGYYVIGLDIVESANQIDSENYKPIKCNITDELGVKEALKQVCSITNEIDAIIHFAGKYVMNSLVEINYNQIEEVFKTNFFGSYLINKNFLPLLKKGSRVITITSELATLNPLPFTGIYAITKSTLDKYCYSLRMELQLLGIDVCVIRAGAVNTNMLGASTKSLEDFCNNTNIYNYNAAKFKKIVDKIETKNISPERLSRKVMKVLNTKRPKFAYKINANFYLKLLNIMPKRFQFWIIKKILKSK